MRSRLILCRPFRLRFAGLVLRVLALSVPVIAPSGLTAQPMQLPGAAGSAPVGTPVAPPPPAGQPGAGQPPGTPRPPSAPAVRAVADDAVVGQALMHQGTSGRLVMERRPEGYGLRFSAEGFQITNLLEPCGVSFGEQAVPLESLGRPAGLPRFRLQSSVCPIVVDVLNNALLVVEPQTPCVIEAAQCRLTPRGLWGPDARGLVALARDIEKERVRAESQVREGFRQLGVQGGNDERRDVAREQAGFSSEREQICREFSREASHSFCAAKVTEARAASVRARLTKGAGEPAARR